MSPDLRQLINLVEAASTSDTFTDKPTAEQVARKVRSFLEAHWTEWHETKKAERAKWADTPYEYAMPSERMCRFTVAFLAIVLRKETGETWKIRGGSPWPPKYPDGGMLSTSGNWEGHYWLERNGTIIDITADQFGYEPVLITSSTDPRYKPNYSPSEIKSHLADARITPAKWLVAYARETGADLDEDASGMPRRPVIDTPEFRRWFAGSKAVDAHGEPLILYHGTSKDTDFKAFKVPKNGVWFTTDPKSASAYAEENDSQGSKWDPERRAFMRTHTASRVIPVYLKITNPKRFPSLPEELRHVQNYRKAQGQFFDRLRAEGYDSVIFGDDVYVLLDRNAPSKIKSAIGNKAFSDTKKNIHEAGGLTPRLTVNSPAFRNWFRDSKVVDAQGNPLPVYHGTGRPDRVGTQFRKSRATSGPMAYFTDDPGVASGYATNKADTSLSDDQNLGYSQWFWVKVPGRRKEVSIDRAWWFLPYDMQKKIAVLAPRVTQNDDGEIVLGDESHTTGNGSYDYEIRAARGNALAALVESWLTSGVLFGEEREFLKVLRLAGLTLPVRMADPRETYPFVYAVYLSIQNPLVTTAIPQNVLDALGKEAARRRAPRRRIGADAWDKRTVDPRQWFRDLLDDIESTSGAHSWTTIPDWVTETLKRLGYDGIKDVGGKNGGPGHTVWIPFEENQVKSAIANRNFNPAKKNIHEGGVELDEDASHLAKPVSASQFSIWLGKAYAEENGLTPYEVREKGIFGGGVVDDDVDAPIKLRTELSDEALDFVRHHEADIAKLGWHLTDLKMNASRRYGGGMYHHARFEPSFSAPVAATGDLWHVTTKAALPHILTHGLQPRESRHGFRYPAPRIYLATSRETASRIIEQFRERDVASGRSPGDYILLRVTASGIRLHRDPQLKSGVYTYDPIPPEAITPVPSDKVEESVLTEVGEHDLNRCTSVSCNAILNHFKLIPLNNNEVPRTAAECVHKLEGRGLRCTPGMDDIGLTVKNFVRKHKRGVWFIGTKGHAMALIEGELIDTENKGPDSRVVEVYAEVGRPGAPLHESDEGED